jgi:hypothetical protein
MNMVLPSQSENNCIIQLCVLIFYEFSQIYVLVIFVFIFNFSSCTNYIILILILLMIH